MVRYTNIVTSSLRVVPAIRGIQRGSMTQDFYRRIIVLYQAATDIIMEDSLDQEMDVKHAELGIAVTHIHSVLHDLVDIKPIKE